ncbi:MAG: peptidoglycan bridge formation glycyltransferase FemA/FemB family protein [Clostridia bacterium]|nr:peptidoglycan bridge formation glycyltransferase FemA/FemB family protein [Clostridia bacterium]
MYRFCLETDKNAFEQFVLDNKGLYMQSAKWADVKLEWKSRFYSGFDENGKRVLTALVMERSIPLAGKIWYSPAGAVCDYSNEELLKEFSLFIKAEMKKSGAVALFFDPCIELRNNSQTNEFGKKVHDTLVSTGFKLNTDASKCLYKAPVQLILPLFNEDGTAKTPEKLLKSFEKGVRYSARVGENRGLTQAVYTIEDIEKDESIMQDFLDVMKDTSERSNFVERGGEYCKRLMRVFGKDNMDMMLIYYDKNKDKQLENERLEKKEALLKSLETAPEKKKKGILEEIDAIDKQSEHYLSRVEETKNEKKDRICVSGGITVHYAGMSSCLFGGSKNLLRNNLRSSHYFNYRRIVRSIEKGSAFHDLGYVLLKASAPNPDGTLGECVPSEDFEGICAFKKSFGADYIEYIGEYVLVSNKAAYFSYTHLIEKARKAQSVVNRIVKARR